MFGRCAFLVVWLKTVRYPKDLSSHFSYFLVLKAESSEEPKNVGIIFDRRKYTNRFRSQKGASLICNFLILLYCRTFFPRRTLLQWPIIIGHITALGTWSKRRKGKP